MEEDKKLNEFLKKSVKMVGLEKPSSDFTQVVLSKITKETQIQKEYKYTPLFSKTAWVVVCSVVVAIFVSAIFANSSTESTLYTLLKLNQLTAFNLSGSLPNIPFLNIFMYGFCAIAFFAWMHIFLVYKPFKKRYQWQS